MDRWIASLLVLQTLVWGGGCVPAPVYRSPPDEKPDRADPHRPQPPPRDAPGRPRTPPKVATPEQTAHPVDPAGISTANAYQVGMASYYGEQFHGKKTANGETFNMYKLTAAHRVLPLGTVVKVTNLDNGRWVVVKVNDRGPFVEGRVLDVSFAAALELEMVKSGKAKVMIELVETAD